MAEEELIALRIQITEAEKALEHCKAALELVPIWALEKGQTWIPSEVAILLLKKAKGSVTNYAKDHWQENNEP